jgi:hypothetical protein
MSEWDQDFVDLVAPGHLTIKEDGTGQFQFGAVEAGIDRHIEKIGEAERLTFTFEGSDEGDDVSGWGWAEVKGGKMNGWFSFHLGDDSTFKAEKKM